ncbi:MAG: glycosyltransferase family 39 protein [Candidatus Omnitrophica bacterium]|nr:glycosyltransferase family 39 protein [Candidatus Omnitrophota bacterium]MBU1853432.1 glycosyltransferase family 39 protein [Candidatus Omnitrophota bacterium]
MRKKRRILLIVIFFIGISLRLASFSFNQDNLDMDDDEPWSRINLAMVWLESGEGIVDLNFSPLYTYMVSTLRFFDKKNFILLTRLVSLVFGSLFIFLYFNSVEKIFNAKIAYLSAFFVAVYPLHIHLSTLSLPEVIACFFLFASLFFLHQFLYVSDRWTNLIISALFLTYACMLRFECWLFILIFSTWIFVKRKISKGLLIFLFLSLIFPSVWMFVNYRYTGNPVNFVFISAEATKYFMSTEDLSLRDKIWGWPKVLYYTLGSPLFILCCMGFIVPLVFRKFRNVFYYSFAIFFSIYMVKSINNTYSFDIWRYSLPLGLFFIPFAGVIIYSSPAFFQRKKYFIMFICLLVFFACIKTSYVFSKGSQAPETLNKVVEWIKANISDSNKRILLEISPRYPLNHPYIVINSNLKSYQHLGFFSTGMEESDEKWDEFLCLLGDANYILVNKEESFFSEIFSEEKEIIEKNVIKVFENEDWFICKLE